MSDLHDLLEYATDSQRRVIEAVIEHGSGRAAAAALGLHHSNVNRMIGRARRAQANRDPRAHDYNGPLPEGFHIWGVTQNLDGAGNVINQYIKTKADRDQQIQLLMQACEASFSKLPTASAVPAPKSVARDIMNVVPIGDMHLGLLASRLNAGGDWNLEMGRKVCVSAVERCVALMEPGELGVLINVGDWTHVDDDSKMTRRSKNLLDVDGLHSEMLEVGVDVQVELIRLMLTKHSKVRVVNAFGNHDDHTSFALSLALKHHFKDEPRVEIDLPYDRFHYIEFGSTLIGVTHGDKGGPKPAELGPVMACDKSEAWARCDNRHWYTGHVHHDSVKDYPGVTVETFRTLAKSDAYHHQKGYRSKRGIKVDVFHRVEGRIERHIIGAGHHGVLDR